MKNQTKEFCLYCNKPLAKDGRCYNNKCVAYDPLSQYFDGPSQEELEADIKSLTERIKNINDSDIVSESDLPF